MHELINADCLDYLAATDQEWTTIFADPPDNIGLIYGKYNDSLSKYDYTVLLRRWLTSFVERAQTVWLSFNSRRMCEIGRIAADIRDDYHPQTLKIRFCVQTFTFGQHNQRDLVNCYRPLLRLRWPDAPLLPDVIRVESWRQRHGDKRADPRGKVPSDVFNFPRVTGNSKQHRSWCPTQLNEGLVARCIHLTTPEGGTVLDPFAGTATTLRVCKRLGLPCTLIEIDPEYCRRIAEEHGEEIHLINPFHKEI